jgi:ribosomal RNA-processing protein 17
MLILFLQLREERRQAVEEHVQAVTQILREAEAAGTEGKPEDGGSDSDEWNGLDDGDDNVVPEEPIDMEEEYIDEDRYTTVTVEAVSVDRDGLHKPGAHSKDEEEDGSAPKDTNEEEKTETASDDKKTWPKKKKKKVFRYETKQERVASERRQKARKSRR